MKVQNGIHVYDQYEKPPIPEGLRTDFEVYSPYDFKIIEIDGRKMWVVATKEEYRDNMAQLHGISPDDVDLDRSCGGLNPQTCYYTSCGSDINPGTCQFTLNPAGNYYSCNCITH